MRASQPDRDGHDSDQGLWQESFGSLGASLSELHAGGVRRKQLYRLRTDPDYAHAVAQMMVLGRYPDNWFLVDVNYDQPIEQVVKSHLDLMQLQPEWFPPRRHGQQQLVIQLVELRVSADSLKSQDARLRLDMWGLRPIGLQELAALVAQHPQAEAARKIVALDAEHQLDQDTTEVAVLRRDDLNQLGRSIYLDAGKFTTNTTWFGAVGAPPNPRMRH